MNSRKRLEDLMEKHPVIGEAGYTLDSHGCLVGPEGYVVLDPYGSLSYAVGDDDFICFDYHVKIIGPAAIFVCVESTLNCETAHFIEDFVGYADVFCPLQADMAPRRVRVIVDTAMGWLYENGVRHNKTGWRQDEWYFYRSFYLDYAQCLVDLELGPPPLKFSDREKRFGGKRINKFCQL